MQYLCHLPTLFISCGLAVVVAPCARADAPAATYDYPTLARVDYVNQCVENHGGKLAALYQCSCAIDRIAAALRYDDYVEVTTFVKNANMPGEGGGMFRDSVRGRELTKSFRALEADALRNCGMSG